VFAFILTVGELIWKGLQVAARVTLEVLKWTVAHLSLVVTKLVNGLKTIGTKLLVGLQKTWRFFEHTYERVLKPAWTKFWRWFDKFRRWLDKTFGPTLAWLRRLRDNLLRFWARFVRPWLDLIDVTRKVLRVLASLGLNWARELDRRLADIEARIQRPFTLLLAKVNEVINIVNRVVTLDGLLQRVALVRSLARDYKYAWNVIKSAYDEPLSDADKRALADKHKPRDFNAVHQEMTEYLSRGTGPRAGLVDETVLSILIGLRGPS
jgi:hypothetical protein